ncbi:hypothetical protein CEXT_591861 [Caerostris extrusa]|uniref:Uncharacterized protein n=1 Tax=Caerostris extrusa TaxID=172846 RepID=A0AAV4W6U1_CAEEX|nr:hypothetical protein CEXT_591861 [Caerostris extrusa]
MNEMEISNEGNGSSEDHRGVLSTTAVDAMIKKQENEKLTPEGMCRQLTTALKEIDVIDSIVAQSQRSDLPQDYLQINENLLQKKHYLVEWVSRFPCPVVNCPLHTKNVNTVNMGKINDASVDVNINSANTKNAKVNKLTVNSKNKSKRNASHIANNDNDKDSGEFKTPSKN